MDEKVGDRVNVLNLARYQTRQKQARLRDLQLQYKQYADEDGGSGGGGAESGGSAGSAGRRGDSDGKADSTKSGDNKEDEEGQVLNSFNVCVSHADSSFIVPNKYH